MKTRMRQKVASSLFLVDRPRNYFISREASFTPPPPPLPTWESCLQQVDRSVIAAISESLFSKEF